MIFPNISFWRATDTIQKNDIDSHLTMMSSDIPLSYMKTVHPIRFQYLIFRTLTKMQIKNHNPCFLQLNTDQDTMICAFQSQMQIMICVSRLNMNQEPWSTFSRSSAEQGAWSASSNSNTNHESWFTFSRSNADQEARSTFSKSNTNQRPRSVFSNNQMQILNHDPYFSHKSQTINVGVIPPLLQF